MNMKKITLGAAFFIAALGLQAQTTYYIDAVNGNDDNAGTQEQPWQTLDGNVDTWRSTEATIYLAEGEYNLLQKLYLENTIEIIGEGKDKVFVQAASDDEFEGDRYGNLPYSEAGFFGVAEGSNVEISGITIKNLRVGVDGGTEAVWGGAITVGLGATLTMNNVDFFRCLLPIGGGAGIDSNGALDLTNVKFSECQASTQGAAIRIAGNAIAKFEGCVFERNTGTTTIQVFPMETLDEPCADLRFNNCYFEGNDYSAGQYTSCVAVDNFYGNKLIFHVTNSTFANNLGNKQGCLFFTTDPAKDRVIDMYVANTTFMHNYMKTGTHGSCFMINRWTSATLTGEVSFVNNTFFRNGKTEESDTQYSSEIFFVDQAYTLNLINNLILTQPKGNGIVWGSSFENTTCNFKNNIYEQTGGTSTLNSRKEFEAASTKIGQSAGKDEETGDTILFIDSNESAKLELELRPQDANKAPYLALLEGSVAIDAGYNDGGALVPATDVRGIAIANEKKDVGAYEYTGATSLEGAGSHKTISAFYNAHTGMIHVEEVVSASLYNAVGKLERTVNNTTTIDINDLPRGVYILTISNENGKSASVKIAR